MEQKFQGGVAVRRCVIQAQLKSQAVKLAAQALLPWPIDWGPQHPALDTSPLAPNYSEDSGARCV
jgi:hypothetical protein